MRTSALVLTCALVAISPRAMVAQSSITPPTPATTPAQPPAAPDQPVVVSIPRDMSAPLTPARRLAAWNLQAAGVAAGLSLDTAKTEAISEVYRDRRGRQAKGADRIEAEIARGIAAKDRPAVTKARADLEAFNTQQRDQLRADLGRVLDAKQTDDAMEAMGTFSALWDRLADTLIGFDLPAEKLRTARTPVQRYIVSMSKIPQGDRAAARTVAQAARTMLLEALAKDLSAEQLDIVRTLVTPRGGAQPGGTGGPAPAPRGG